VRSVLIATALVAASAWALVRQLPEGEAQASPHASRPQEIESVSFDGDRLPVAALRDALATRAGDLLDASALAHDRAALQATLAGRGYLRAKVSPAQVNFDDDGGAFVTFAIAQGTEFHVRSVNIAGVPAKEAGVVTIAEGEVASPAHIEEARQALAAWLAARGAPATVTVQIATDAAAGVVDVTLLAQH
jgi:outer membrane protein assembly factor BamA